MKKFSKIFAAIAAIVLVAAASVSCDKHAYSISTNHFGYYDGSRVKEIGQTHSISLRRIYPGTGSCLDTARSRFEKTAYSR